MPNANREAAANRIRALLSKTVANGCTESEALAAAAKAGELMDRYTLTLSDVEIKRERCQQREATDRRHDVYLVATAIARFCGCRSWTDEGRVQYFGLPQDVEVAAYLTDLCRSSMDAGFRAFLRSPERPRFRDGHPLHGRHLRKPFMVAMAGRLADRIFELAEAREATATTATGTALVLVRNAVVEEQFGALGLRLRWKRDPRYWGNDAATDAGLSAGDRVNLTTGIRGTSCHQLAG